MNLRNTKFSHKLLGRLLIVPVILLIFTGIMWARGKIQSPKEITGPVQTYLVERRNLIISVIESGDLQARYATDITCQIEGPDHTIIYLIDEGTRLTEQDVENGTVLVEFDSSRLKEIEVRLDVAYNDAIAAHEEAQRNYEIQLQQNISDVTAAELQENFALMDLRKYLGADLAEEMLTQNSDHRTVVIPQVDSSVLAHIDENTQSEALQNLRNIQNAVDNARESLQRTESKLQGTRKLFENQFVTKMQLDADEAAANQAQRNLASRQALLDLFLDYDFEKQAKQLFTKYQEAIWRTRRVKDYARARLAQAQARLNAMTVRLHRQEEFYRRTQDALEACIIRAPAAGMIVYQNQRSRGRQNNRVELGGRAQFQQKLMTIPNTSEMAVRVDVHEAWIDMIQNGQTALITLDAYPDLTFTGSVYDVALLPKSSRSRFSGSDVKLYECLVSIDGAPSQIRDGMSAKVEIVIDQLEDVLCVPVQAVTTFNSQKVCYVIDPTGPLQARHVEVGAFNNNFIEIKSGLTAGETVSLAPLRLKESPRQLERQKQILIEKALQNKIQN